MILEMRKPAADDALPVFLIHPSVGSVAETTWKYFFWPAACTAAAAHGQPADAGVLSSVRKRQQVSRELHDLLPDILFEEVMGRIDVIVEFVLACREDDRKLSPVPISGSYNVLPPNVLSSSVPYDVLSASALNSNSGDQSEAVVYANSLSQKHCTILT